MIYFVSLSKSRKVERLMGGGRRFSNGYSATIAPSMPSEFREAIDPFAKTHV